MSHICKISYSIFCSGVPDDPLTQKLSNLHFNGIGLQQQFLFKHLQFALAKIRKFLNSSIGGYFCEQFPFQGLLLKSGILKIIFITKRNIVEVEVCIAFASSRIVAILDLINIGNNMSINTNICFVVFLYLLI